MDTLYFRITGVATTLDVGLSMDNPWIHCISELLGCMATTLDVGLPWIIHGTLY